MPGFRNAQISKKLIVLLTFYLLTNSDDITVDRIQAEQNPLTKDVRSFRFRLINPDNHRPSIPECHTT